MLRFILLAVAGTAVLVSGSNNTLDFTVNPDGSGKAVVEMILPPLPPEAAAGAADVMTAQLVKQMLLGTPDVEVWADVAVGKTDDGRLTFKGTAYFKDIATVDLGPSKDDGVTWAKDDKGGMVLTVVTSGSKAPPAEASRPKLSEEEIAKQVDQVRSEFKRRREAMGASMRSMKTELIYRLPGSVSDVTGFTRAKDESLRWTLEGVKMMAAADKAMADDAFLRQCIIDGKDPIREVMMKQVLATLKARVSGDLKPLFDYAAEVKAAKEAYPKMLERLGLNAPPNKAETKTTTPLAPVETPK